MIENYSSLYNKAIQIKSKYDTLFNHLEERKSMKEKLKSQMESSIKNQAIYEDSISYMKEIIDTLSQPRCGDCQIQSALGQSDRSDQGLCQGRRILFQDLLQGFSARA